MGLDITAYSNLKHIGLHYDGEWCEDDTHISAYAFDCFGQSFRGLPVLREHEIGSLRLLEAGCYEVTPATQTHDFRAGSYTGYSRWRVGVLGRFNPEVDPAGPFYELVWFADNEGSIGPDAAKDLLADFQEHAAAFRELEARQDFFREPKYGDWLRACELAADGGLIRFH